MSDTISFKLNDKPVRLDVDGERALLWVLRTDLGLTGTKFSCGEGHCGACTVLADKVPVRSCLWKVKSVSGKEVVTIRGVGQSRQTASAAKGIHGARRLAMRLLHTGHDSLRGWAPQLEPAASREQILRGLENDFCRCGAHTRIVDAVQTAATEMAGNK